MQNVKRPRVIKRMIGAITGVVSFAVMAYSAVSLALKIEWENRAKDRKREP